MRPAWLVLSSVMSVLLVGARADAAAPSRLAWIGLERGPLPPAEAEQLQRLILDDLDGYDSFRLVDASGHALDARLLASEAALLARLKDQGINDALEFNTRRALKKFEQAIDIFEARLIQLQDYELLHDTLLATSEAQFQGGKKAAALTTLKRLAALAPKRFPTPRTHPAGLVRLWNKAKEDLGPVGTISVQCDGCTVQIDGQLLGAGPLLATRIPPGKHYLVAKWGHGYHYETVRVAPGREAKANVERKGPSEDARLGMLGAIERREGAAAAEQVAKKAARLAQSEGVLIAAVKKEADGSRWLLLAKHQADGKLGAIVKAPLPASIEAEETATTVGRIGALLFVEKKPGEHELAKDGSAKPGEKLPEMMYEAASVPDPPPPPPPPKPDGDAIAKVDPPLPPPPLTDPPPPVGPGDDGGIASKWWFWTLIGVVAVGAGVGVGVGVASSNGGNRTDFEVILP